MAVVIEICSGFFLFVGSFLILSGGIGLLRFPDFYSRMHAAGVTETLATSMILIGLMLQLPDALVVIKLVFILLFTLLISPTAGHALAKAAYHSSHKPIIKENTVTKGSKSSNQ